MADGFGLKIGLEGEKEFKKALADINQLRDMSNDVASAGDAVDKNSQKIGISAESYQD